MLLAVFTLMGFVPANLNIGDELPKASVKIKDISGKTLTLNDVIETNGLLVMFSCNTCPYVIKNQQRTRDILKYAQTKNIGVVVLNPNEAYRNNEDSFDAMNEYARENGYQWPYAIDKNHELADAFGASKTPECYLFNNKNKLVYHGAIDDSPADAASVSRYYLKDAINALISGKEIPVKTSRSIGCTIKRLKN